MAYTINLTDGTVFAVIEDGTVDTSSSVTLIGKNVPNYGEILDENYLRLLESGADIDTEEPPTPLTGQVWFDKTSGVLKVYDGATFKNLGSATSSLTEPPGAESVLGDIWFNTTTEQTYIYNGTDYVLIGTTTPLGTNPSDPVVTTVNDGAADHIVVEYYVDGTIVAITSTDAEFTPDPPITGFATIKPGYNLSTTVANAVFNGTATNADALDGLASSQFLRSDTSDTITGSLNINDNSGLFIGNPSALSIAVSGTTAYITQNLTDADVIFRAYDGGTFNDVLLLDGARAVAQSPGTPSITDDIVNLGYLETNFVSASDGASGAQITGDIRIADNTQVAWGNSEDFHMEVSAGLLIATNDTGDMLFNAANGNVKLTGGGTNGTVEVWAGNGGNICINAGQGDDRVTLYWGGSAKLNTLLDGISVTGNVNVSNTTPGLDSHLASKGYVDGKFVAADQPTLHSLSIQDTTLGSWSLLTVNANAKYAFVSGYAYGIFNTGGGQVICFARKPGLSGVAGPFWEVTRTGSSSGDAGSGSDETNAGSTFVECNASGQIEVYAYRSSVAISAPASHLTIKGWIE